MVLIKLDVPTRQKQEDLKFKVNVNSLLCAGEVTGLVKALVEQACDLSSVPAFHSGKKSLELACPPYIHP